MSSHPPHAAPPCPPPSHSLPLSITTHLGLIYSLCFLASPFLRPFLVFSFLKYYRHVSVPVALRVLLTQHTALYRCPPRARAPSATQSPRTVSTAPALSTTQPSLPTTCTLAAAASPRARAHLAEPIGRARPTTTLTRRLVHAVTLREARPLARPRHRTPRTASRRPPTSTRPAPARSPAPPQTRPRPAPHCAGARPSPSRSPFAPATPTARCRRRASHDRPSSASTSSSSAASLDRFSFLHASP